MEANENVLHHATVQQALRRGFLGWQCRIRQYAMRQGGGRPSEGMRPGVLLPGDTRPAARIVVLLVQAEPAQSTAQFRHMSQRTHDPAERFAAALRFLCAGYYQRAEGFSEQPTALFGAQSTLAARLIEEGTCTLAFEQNRQRFTLPCTVRELPADHPWWQATFWHNALFNPALPGDARVLAFSPDWRRAEADPALPGMA